MIKAPNGKEVDQSLIDALRESYPDIYPDDQTAADWIIQNDTRYTEDTENKLFTGRVSEEDQKSIDELKTALMDDSGIRKTLRANGVFEPTDMQYNTYFYPWHRNDPFNRVQSTREIVFFTKPYLPLLSGDQTLGEEYANTPYFRELYKRGYRQTFADLCYGRGAIGSGCPFIHILTNRITASIDVPDVAVDELETAQNLWGTRILYPKSSMSSDENLDFTCEFEDTKYLEIYQLFKAWDLYRQGKWWGIFTPNEQYVRDKILYDQIAVYKFTIAEDGETLLHWCKWTGCYPKSFSRSAFSDIPKEGPLKITVDFKLSGWFEDMEPNILSDFNQLIRNWTGYSSLKDHVYDIWSPDIGAISQDLVAYPFILEGTADSRGFVPYYFEWTRDR